MFRIDFQPFDWRLIFVTFVLPGLGPDVKERAVPSILSGFESTTQFAASGTYSIVLKSTSLAFFNSAVASSLNLFLAARVMIGLELTVFSPLLNFSVAMYR